MQVYYGVPISDNMHRTDQGYLVCRGVPIARTGWHDYKGDELNDPNHAPFQPYQTVRVWREPTELFDPKVMASFEGATVTDEHPDKMISARDDAKHGRGHMANVRQGGVDAEGNQQLLGDLWIKHPELIAAVEEKRKREVSLGYNFALQARDDGSWEQIRIRGNHVAVVPKGRAGRLVTIRDSADVFDRMEKPKMAKSLLARVMQSMSKNADAHTESDYDEISQRLSVVPRNVRAFDADPEDKDDKDEKKAKDRKGKDSDEDDKDDDEKKWKKKAEDAAAQLVAKDAEIAELKKKATEKEAGDDGLELGAVVLSDKDKIQDLMKVAGADSAENILKKMRPSIAASNDKGVMDAYRECVTEVRALKAGAKPAHDKLSSDAQYAGLLKAEKPKEVKDAQQKEGKDADTIARESVNQYQKRLDESRAAKTKVLTA